MKKNTKSILIDLLYTYIDTIKGNLFYIFLTFLFLMVFINFIFELLPIILLAVVLSSIFYLIKNSNKVFTNIILFMNKIFNNNPIEEYIKKFNDEEDKNSDEENYKNFFKEKNLTYEEKATKKTLFNLEKYEEELRKVHEENMYKVKICISNEIPTYFTFKYNAFTLFNLINSFYEYYKRNSMTFAFKYKIDNNLTITGGELIINDKKYKYDISNLIKEALKDIKIIKEKNITYLKIDEDKFLIIAINNNKMEIIILETSKTLNYGIKKIKVNNNTMSICIHENNKLILIEDPNISYEIKYSDEVISNEEINIFEEFLRDQEINFYVERKLKNE